MFFIDWRVFTFVMGPWHSRAPDEHRIRSTAEIIKQTTRPLAHEQEAMQQHLGDQGIEATFELLARAEVISLRLHKQLVDWHTQFPTKPALEDTDRFWNEIKELRSMKERLLESLEAIRAYESQLNSLTTQLETSTSAVDDVERYFEGYLDRVNKN